MDTNIVIVLVVSVIAIIAAVLITAKVTTNRLKKNAEGTIGNAEEKAREIIDEALKTATKERDKKNLKRTKSANHSWKSRKSPFVPRMNWTKKSRNAERKPSGMSAEFSRRKRTSIRKQMPSRSARQV